MTVLNYKFIVCAYTAEDLEKAFGDRAAIDTTVGQ